MAEGTDLTRHLPARPSRQQAHRRAWLRIFFGGLLLWVAAVVVTMITGNPNLVPIIPGDPRGAADNPPNYPVGTVTIFNGLGNFSENSAFNRSTGGHFDTRIEGYLGDTFNLFPNLNISFGVNYVRDSGRTNSDLPAVPCSAINTTIVTTPPCTTGLILDQFGLLPNNAVAGAHSSLGESVNQPDWNFAPQFGVPWASRPGCRPTGNCWPRVSAATCSACGTP